jgi:hypothetical protein
MNLLQYAKAARHVYKEMRIQQQFERSFLVPYLNELEQKYKGHFTAEQRDKILKYYGLFIPSFLCSSYKRLYGKTLNDEERKRAALFGILTPVGDDLFEEDHLSAHEVEQLTLHPDQFEASTFLSKVAKEIQLYFMQHIEDKENYIKASKAVLQAQLETAKQTNEYISKQELKEITYNKGAVSVIIYHSVLQETLTPTMYEVLFYVGSLFQLGNDIFDLYKDVRDGIYTLVNTCTDFIQLKNEFLERVKQQNMLIYQLPYNKKAKEEFCIVMNTINARSMVALQQFIQFQKKHKKKISWQQCSRKDMIVDMEKPMNLLKWLHYIYTLPRLK